MGYKSGCFQPLAALIFDFRAKVASEPLDLSRYPQYPRYRQDIELPSTRQSDGSRKSDPSPGVVVFHHDIVAVYLGVDIDIGST